MLHAQLTWPLGGGVILGGTDSGEADHLEVPRGPVPVHVVTGEPNARVIRGLRDEEYGSRGFTCLDPEDNVWSFGTYSGE